MTTIERYVSTTSPRTTAAARSELYLAGGLQHPTHQPACFGGHRAPLCQHPSDPGRGPSHRSRGDGQPAAGGADHQNHGEHPVGPRLLGGDGFEFLFGTSRGDRLDDHRDRGPGPCPHPLW